MIDKNIDRLHKAVVYVYVWYQIKLWEVEDMMNEFMDDLKKIVKMSK